MVGKAISALPAITTVGLPALTDIFAEVQPAVDGTTYKTTFQQLLTLYLDNLGVLMPAHGATGVANPTIHTLPVAQGTAAFNFLGPLTNGQLLIGSTGVDPVVASITAGSGMSVTAGAGSITIATSAINNFVKFSSASESNLITTSGAISAADVIPTNTDGSQVLSVTHTPSNASNILEIEVTLQLAGQTTVSAQTTAALFQDSTVNAIAAGGCDDGDTGSRITPLTFKKIMVAGTTSATTFKVRLGASDGSACYLNGQTATRAYGGVSMSTITVKEYTP